MVWPFVSVWRISGQVLDELPPIEGTSIDDRRGVSALWDGDFTLATRTYLDADPDQVRRGFAGFQSTSVGTIPYLAKECCGEWDAVFVSLAEGPGPGSTVATVTVFDSDIQATYPFLVMFGLFLAVIGLGIGAGARLWPDSVEENQPTPAEPLTS